MSSVKSLIFVGNIVNPKDVSVNSFLCVENGTITHIGDKTTFEKFKTTSANQRIIQLGENQFLMPGFVDCHTHAPQFPNLGLGLDKPLLEWLDTYTFPLEKKYSDVDFASKVYDKVVKRLLNKGTTTACYFGTIHLEGTLELVKSTIKHHQRALVGKVNMNEENNHGYYNSTETEIEETVKFIKNVLDLKNDLVQPLITPRFAVSCNKQLMKGLASLAKSYGVGIQSHISENLKEIEYVLHKHPDCDSYSQIYDKCDILTDKCIMAHAVHLSESEMKLFAAKGVSVAHCPASNTRLVSGTCPVKKLIQHGVTVGLGTDVSGGDNASILDAMRRAMDVATFVDSDNKITSDDALYLATLGGAKALNLDDKIGSLEVGKEFDALLIDVYPKDGPITHFPEFPEVSSGSKDYVNNLVQRFIYGGDDRNIVQVYVKGEKVKDTMN